MAFGTLGTRRSGPGASSNSASAWSPVPDLIQFLYRNRSRYLAFPEYPTAVRPMLQTKNAGDAVNGQLEILRRNSGGYFQSRRSLQCKLALAVRHL